MNGREEIRRLTLYTGSNGKKGCTCNCIGCSQEKYGKSTPFYQGTERDIIELLDLIPNVKDCIILGNPDPSVDPEFCNWVAKYMISKGIRIRMSSSGVNAVEVVKTLFKDIDVNYVDYMSYSIDSINEAILWKLKGRKISLEQVDEAIEYCKFIGIRPKIQPTIWKINKNDYRELIMYYLGKGVKWYSFHVGSVESFTENKIFAEHISPAEWITIRDELKEMCKIYNFSIHMPQLFMNNDEYLAYKKERGERCHPYDLKNTQIWIEKDRFRTTHCPLLRETRVFEYNLRDMDKSKIDYQSCKNGYCPVAKQCLGQENCDNSLDGEGNKFEINGKIYHTICRSYNFNHNRPIMY